MGGREIDENLYPVSSGTPVSSVQQAARRVLYSKLIVGAQTRLRNWLLLNPVKVRNHPKCEGPWKNPAVKKCWLSSPTLY